MEREERERVRSGEGEWRKDGERERERERVDEGNMEAAVSGSCPGVQMYMYKTPLP